MSLHILLIYNKLYNKVTLIYKIIKKDKKLFGFLLTYSYLCIRNQYLYHI